jgi:hypothetical protein
MSPPGVQLTSAIVPPGAQTRTSSSAVTWWRGANWIPNTDTTRSNDASANGSASASPPPLWGDEDHVRALFAAHDVQLRFERAVNRFRFASVDASLDLFEQRYGPLVKARERLAADGGWARCRAELRELLLGYDEAIDGTFDAPSEYLVVTARRR